MLIKRTFFLNLYTNETCIEMRI